jgi:hypothetical protein
MFFSVYMSLSLCVYMSGGQNYLFPVIATGKTGSFLFGCDGCEGSSLLLSNAQNFVGYSYIPLYLGKL